MTHGSPPPFAGGLALRDQPLISFREVTKRFPGLVANDRITLDVMAGTIHAIVGENGAGKSTLMKILAGLYHPDGGTLLWRGRPLRLRGPRQAAATGIGMVYQHFMLIPNFTILENVVLGVEETRRGALAMREMAERVRGLARSFGFDLDPFSLVEDLSVGQQQQVEILKVLYRGAELLILDEPTAVLVPQAVQELLATMRRLKATGKTIVFISHHLDEVLEVADRVSVLRRGRLVGTLEAKDTSKEQLAEMMVGRPVVLQLEKPEVSAGPEASELLLEVRNLSVSSGPRTAVSDVSFAVRGREIVGVAGVEGNGQSELIYAIMGLLRPSGGRVLVRDEDVTGLSARQIRDHGVSFIPEDRHRQGMVLGMSVWENAILGQHRTFRARWPAILDRAAAVGQAEHIVRRYTVRTPSVHVAAETLSGGNQQKLVLGKELEAHPSLIVAAQPTRGLDVGAVEFVWRELLAARARGVGVLLVSADLEEILSLSDRVLVMFRGRLVAELEADRTTAEEIGAYMLGSRGESA